ncbi:hypothetical protein GW7_06953 [Heterocephalus glaber]|uniref:Uncharacterized protein n=1 Tax=Heterocephalus glaber TaxID=10181 RepID=G5BRP9_HETGA|nr:hypothetical protein GW7_06953 [Heterocephalus glaber]
MKEVDVASHESQSPKPASCPCIPTAAGEEGIAKNTRRTGRGLPEAYVTCARGDIEGGTHVSNLSNLQAELVFLLYTLLVTEKERSLDIITGI